MTEQDEVLNKIIQTIPLPPQESTNNVFHDLLSCIIEQQIHYRSTKKTFQKLLAQTGLDELTTANFPILEEKGLKNIKLSMRKYETIGRIVEFFESHTLDWGAMKDEDVEQALSKIKGVGNWSIKMILLYTLQRPDVFPADDYHLKQIMIKLYNIDTAAKVKAQLKAVAGNWSPCKSIGVRYLLAWKEHQKNAVI